QAGVDLHAPGGGEPEPVEDPGAEVLDEHIGPGDQPGQCVLAGVGLEIEGDGFLVAVAGEEVGGLRIVFGPDDGRAPGTRIVSPARLLDLDHTRTEAAEHPSRWAPGRRAGRV